MATRVRPTSRGRARCASFRMGRQSEQTAAGSRAGACRLRRCALGDAALPRRGKGRCKCAGSTLFALRAKALQSGAPDFGVVAGENRELWRFAHQERLAGAPGERKHAVLRSMRPPSSRNHPAGRTAGSARTRSRDQSLENPFLGERQPFPRSPRPQRRRRQAPARGLAAVYSHHRSKRNETKRPSPLLVGLGRVYFEPTALAGGTAALCRVSWPFFCILR